MSVCQVGCRGGWVEIHALWIRIVEVAALLARMEHEIPKFQSIYLTSHSIASRCDHIGETMY